MFLDPINRLQTVHYPYTSQPTQNLHSQLTSNLHGRDGSTNQVAPV